MTDLLSRPVARRRESGQSLPPLPLRQAILAGIAAAVVGVVVVAALVLVSWGTDSRSDASTLTALRTVCSVWIFAHHAPLHVGTGAGALHLGLVPLGLFALPVSLLARAGAKLGRALARTGLSDPEQLRRAGQLIAAFAATYGVLAAIAIGAIGDVPMRTNSVPGALWSIGVALVAGGIGLLTGAGLWPALTGYRLPPMTVTVLRAGGAALAAILTAGALLVAASMALATGRAAALADHLGTGIPGGFLLAVIGCLYAPNAVICGAAFAVGPGFAVGVGTSVSASGSHLGTVPAFPLLAALPQGEHVTHAAWLAFAGPAVGGLLAGLVIARFGARWFVAAAAAIGAGAVAGFGLMVLAAAAGGSLGSGNLAAIGPSPWRVGLAAAAEVAVVAAVAAVMTTAVRRYRSVRA